ncbi:dna-directed rna polymerases i ii and iii subunit rpabc2 [Holotrichia oblita]|uniref:Dna-directed rna polymerases i ii and iii subunit rpabc2 n=1 Tax=Holotrichia oblita TaxID=644536 RepID=A0ACB9TIF4_HOLOL|nr:dna-directed rna polymerases i ii and iii subunit rpabc2 [Holotrichia oblita]
MNVSSRNRLILALATGSNSCSTNSSKANVCSSSYCIRNETKGDEDIDLATPESAELAGTTCSSCLSEVMTEKKNENEVHSFSDNSDDDPNYAPSDISEVSKSTDTSEHEDIHIQDTRKKKITLKVRSGRKRRREASEWIDVKAKRLLNAGLKHKNRKGKTIEERKLGESCKETRKYNCRTKGKIAIALFFSMFAQAANTFQLLIIHRFLEKGHTQNEDDSMHAVIENAKKRVPSVYTPDQWITLIKMAKVTGEPYVVKEMSQEDFFFF